VKARLAVFLLLSTVPTSANALRPSIFTATDHCLDVGNAWNYRSNACEAAPSGPIDRIYIDKSEHWMAVYRGGEVIREFRVALGVGGLKPKSRVGDGRVPEGVYTISAHNPDSAYHLALRISYPTPEQSAAAAERGITAGGDIMIHGLPNGHEGIGSRHRMSDWTDGCIAVTNREVEWLYMATPDGTPVEIRA
jgi:murein L,D-transpeptidase YafK